MRIRIGTRGSRLALAQTGSVARQLADNGHDVETTIIRTRGDLDRTSAFPEFGGAGVFVREIERALLAGEIDLAVHSYKDLPSEGPAQLVVAAVPERVDPADLLVVRAQAMAPPQAGLSLAHEARIGTSSARRQALLRHLRPDLQILPLRGNVDTRVSKLRAGDYDAIVLAAAGLQRLQQEVGGSSPTAGEDLVEHRLDPVTFVPAPTQGALALQTRATDAELIAALRPLHRDELNATLQVERQLMARIEGNCSLPFGAWCQSRNGRLHLVCAVNYGDGLRRATLSGEDPGTLADQAWKALQPAAEAP